MSEPRKHCWNYNAACAGCEASDCNASCGHCNEYTPEERIEKLEKLLAAAVNVINSFTRNEGYIPFLAKEDYAFIEDVLGVRHMNTEGGLQPLPPGFSKEWRK